MEQALEALGVHDAVLSADEIAFLDTHGYLPLGGILTRAEVDAFNARLAELLMEEGPEAGSELRTSGNIRHRAEQGVDRLSDLVNKDPLFEICFTHPRVLAAVGHVIGEAFKLSSLNYRAARPGDGLQALHVDWPEAVPPGQFKVCNSIWLLDDFTEENGATRLVPGSHRWGTTPQEALADPMAPHPDEVQIVAPAGTVVIFNSHTWHGGTRNRTDRPRRAIHSYFCRRDQVQQIDQRRFLREETRRRLSAAARFILDV